VGPSAFRQAAIFQGLEKLAAKRSNPWKNRQFFFQPLELVMGFGFILVGGGVRV
jgi:hypothetical protein